MLVDWNEGYISVCPAPDLIPVEDKNTYIPTSTWGYIKGSVSEQKDLMNLLANITSGLSADQIALLTNADIRLNEVEQDIAELSTTQELDFANLTAKVNTKANVVDVYTKSEIDSRNYLTEHQSLTGYATENWVYSKGYLSTETDPIWNAEKHKYALKAELPSMVGYAKENWVSEQLTAKANVVDIYSKIEIDGKKYITESQLNTELLAKANTGDVYSKIEIDGKNFATKDWTATELLAYAKLGDVYTKTEMDDKEFINETRLTEELTAKANLTDVYTKIEIDGKNLAPKDWVATELLAYAKVGEVWTKDDMANGSLTKEDLKIDGYATEDWVRNQKYLTEHQSLDNYYTKDEVDTAIENVEVDLSEYYTKSEVDTAIENVEVDLTGYATEVYVDTGLEKKVDYDKIWTGTKEEWESMSVKQQESYIIAMVEI